MPAELGCGGGAGMRPFGKPMWEAGGRLEQGWGEDEIGQGGGRNGGREAVGGSKSAAHQILASFFAASSADLCQQNCWKRPTAKREAY